MINLKRWKQALLSNIVSIEHKNKTKINQDKYWNIKEKKTDLHTKNYQLIKLFMVEAW